MGNGMIKHPQAAKIDQQLRRDNTEALKTIRLILLGSGGSGKSTLVRQMKMLKTGEYTPEEVDYFRNHIRYNLVDWTLKVADSGDTETQELEVLRVWSQTSIKELDVPLVQAIMSILSNRGRMDKALTALPDSAGYVFENAARITAKRYVPTSEDIVRCRIATTGVHELHFSTGHFLFVIIDVGGQRGQRKKWVHCFENLQAMIFVTSLSDFDRTLDEDGHTNRMMDSFQLWNELARCRTFRKTPTMIFFNKTDLFEEALERSSLTVCFPGFVPGPDLLGSAKVYVEQRFVACVPTGKDVYTHFTTATDKSNVDRVMQVTTEIVLNMNMQRAGTVE